MAQTPRSVQVNAMMEGIEQMRESIRGMVAALVADGFTDEQAREIITGAFRAKPTAD